jgi:hypothetical protein
MVLAAAIGGLALLLVLACPISMGLMMLFMGRGMRSGHKGDDAKSETESLAALKAEQARLAAKIDALKEPESSGAPIEPTRAA